jgi:lipopolysaccharide export system protein LptA
MLKNIILTIFFVSCLIITYLGVDSSFEYTIGNKKLDHVLVKNQSFFSQFELYMSNLKGPVLNVSGDEMAIDHTANTIQFFSPKGKIKRPKKVEFLSYEAQKGTYLYDKNEVILRGDVFFFDNQFQLKGSEVAYDFKNDLVKAKGGVQSSIRHEKNFDILKISSERLQGRLSEKTYKFEGKVSGEIKRRRRYESNLNFLAESVSLSEGKGLIHLDQDVELKFRNFRATSHKGEIFLENYNKKLKYYVLSDDVRVVEQIKIKGNRPIERKAFSEFLEGKMRERKMILSGFPKVIQSGSVLTGNSIVLFENKKVIEVIDANSIFKVGNGN